MTVFLGLDSSTQSISAVVIDLDSASIVCEQSVRFGDELPEFGCPNGVLPNPDPLIKHSDPLIWVAGLDRVFGKLAEQGVDLSLVKGVSGSGQQHGTVYLGPRALIPEAWQYSGDVTSSVAEMLTRKSAPIWMDSSTSAECAEIAQAAGGTDYVRETTGSPAVERFSGPQIRKFCKESPAQYDQTAVIHLVSSFMCSVMIGRNAGIDPGDAAGMNLMNLATRNWDPRMLDVTAPNLAAKLPLAVCSDSVAGTVSDAIVRKHGFVQGTPVVTWSGDNPNSLIGVGAWEPGTVVVSLGTSDTLFAAMQGAEVDPNGYGHVFGNPAGGYMSLICFKNGALAREAVKNRYNLDWSQFEECLDQTPAGNSGNMMLPYFVPEITPLVLDARPIRMGSQEFIDGQDKAGAVRAVIEAQAMRLKIHSAWISDRPRVVRVTGGGSQNTAICQILADVFSARVERLETSNSAALGAAMRAAHAVTRIGWQELTEKFCIALK